MLDVLSIDFAGGLVFVQPLGDNSGTEEIDLEDVELLQYTGINDCNNVEIYDGDICVDSKDNVIRIMQTNSYQWGCKVIKADNVSIRGLTFPLWQWDDDRKFKKVGNIYENQELMESEK